MTTNADLIELLNKVFDRVRGKHLPESEDPSHYTEWQRDFSFHLTDWIPDLERLQALFKDPSKFDDETASTVIVAFLTHVLPHLNAAGRILLDEVSDPFRPLETKRGKKRLAAR